MRPEPNRCLDLYRAEHPERGMTPAGVNWGWFVIPRKTGTLRVMSSGSCEGGSDDWEHVSVSLADRCPTWDEMVFVKDLFWSDTETVVQFHPPKSEYVNRHEFCLHLWRRPGHEPTLPPRGLIG